MFVFLVPAIILGVFSTYIELKVLRGLPWLGVLYREGLGPIKGELINLTFSLCLSAVLGTVFGAVGLIVFMSGMFSTAFTVMYIRTQKVCNDSGWTAERFKVEMTKKGEETVNWWNSNKIHFVNLGKTIMALIKIVTAPVHAAIWVNDKAHSGKENLNNMRNQAKVKLDEMRGHVRLVRPQS